MRYRGIAISVNEKNPKNAAKGIYHFFSNISG